jgi:hypothetical protein
MARGGAWMRGAGNLFDGRASCYDGGSTWPWMPSHGACAGPWKRGLWRVCGCRPRRASDLLVGRVVGKSESARCCCQIDPMAVFLIGGCCPPNPRLCLSPSSQDAQAAQAYPVNRIPEKYLLVWSLATISLPSSGLLSCFFCGGRSSVCMCPRKNRVCPVLGKRAEALTVG